MTTYAIGDVQGCFDELKKLLKKIQFSEDRDELWFAGDLVNRGPKSLDVLRFIHNLPNKKVVLGNHDFHLLTLALANKAPAETFSHTMDDIVNAKDRDDLLDWLCEQPLTHYDPDLKIIISHAGIPPAWDVDRTLRCSKEVEQMLQSDQRAEFLSHLFGNLPDEWHDDLRGWDRLRYIVNALTRMRYVSPEGKLILEVKGKPEDQPPGHIPWFEFDNQVLPTTRVLFGHWASLEGKSTHPNAIALDTGCVWGGRLSAVRLKDMTFFSVP